MSENAAVSGRSRGSLEPPQRQAEERLDAAAVESSALAERLQVALEAGRLGIGEWTFATDEVKSSPRHEEIHGLVPGPHTSDDLRKTIHPDDRERVRRELSEAIRPD
jgi:hypothetical protein